MKDIILGPMEAQVVPKPQQLSERYCTDPHGVGCHLLIPTPKTRHPNFRGESRRVHLEHPEGGRYVGCASSALHLSCVKNMYSPDGPSGSRPGISAAWPRGVPCHSTWTL